MSNIINALKKANQARHENKAQTPGQENLSKQAVPTAEHVQNPQLLHFVRLNAGLCVVLIVLIGAGLWVNFKVASGMAVAKNDMAVIAEQIKGQSDKLSQLNDTIARLEKANDRQKQDMQERLVKINDSLRQEFEQQKQILTKTIEKQGETISKLTFSQEQVKAMFKDYKMINQELSSRVDNLQQKINSFTAVGQ